MIYAVATKKGQVPFHDLTEALVAAINATAAKKHFVEVLCGKGEGHFTPCTYHAAEATIGGKKRPPQLTPQQVKNYLAMLSMQNAYAIAA